MIDVDKKSVASSKKKAPSTSKSAGTERRFVKANRQSLTPDQKTAILARIPAGRLGDSKDVAAAVVYLASEEAQYVTGQTLHVNGGMANTGNGSLPHPKPPLVDQIIKWIISHL